mgnify:CR=1
MIILLFVPKKVTHYRQNIYSFNPTQDYKYTISVLHEQEMNPTPVIIPETLCKTPKLGQVPKLYLQMLLEART